MPIFYIGIYFYHVTWSRQNLLHQVRSCVPCLKFLPSLITQIYFLPSQLHNFGDWSYASRFISTLVSLGSVRQQCWCHHHNHCHHQHHSGHTAALWTMHLLTFVACAAADKLVGLITCKQGSIHWLHTRWTCEASHKPVINTFHMVCMHAREVAYRITNHEFDHADHTPGNIYMLLGKNTRNNTSVINNEEQHFPCRGKIVYTVFHVFVVFNILTIDTSWNFPSTRDLYYWSNGTFYMKTVLLHLQCFLEHS